MSPQSIFAVRSVLGYATCLLCFNAYLWPRLKSMETLAAQRVIATLNSSRFFGFVAILPGVVGPNLPSSLATVADYWDLAAGVLAVFALLTAGVRSVFWFFVVVFNFVGMVDLILTYYQAVRVNLPALAGQLGDAYVINTFPAIFRIGTRKRDPAIFRERFCGCRIP